MLALSLHANAQAANPQACAACHGARGEGGSTGAPALAGQPQAYLVRQLDAYADGSRQHAVMSPIARGLRPEEREELAAYYARLQPPARPPQVGVVAKTTAVALDRREQRE